MVAVIASSALGGAFHASGEFVPQALEQLGFALDVADEEAQGAGELVEFAGEMTDLVLARDLEPLGQGPPSPSAMDEKVAEIRVIGLDMLRMMARPRAVRRRMRPAVTAMSRTKE